MPRASTFVAVSAAAVSAAATSCTAITGLRLFLQEQQEALAEQVWVEEVQRV